MTLGLLLLLGSLVPVCCETTAAHGQRRTPHRLSAASRPLITISAAEWESFATEFESLFNHNRQRPSVSGYLHYVRFKCATLLEEERNAALLPLLKPYLESSAAEERFGRAILIRTRTGVRFRPNPQIPALGLAPHEAHQSQVLAIIAEAGLPLSTIIRADNVNYQLRDVLADTIANYRLGQTEIEWTAVCVGLYVGATASWQNKYNETLDLDCLARDLLSRKVDSSASCAGTHLLFAMVLLDAVNVSERVLSREVGTRLHDAIDTILWRLRSSQLQDGSWTAAWWHTANNEGRSSTPGSLLVTGHLGECVVYLSSKHTFPSDALARAGEWAWRELMTLRQTTS